MAIIIYYILYIIYDSFSYLTVNFDANFVQVDETRVWTDFLPYAVGAMTLCYAPQLSILYYSYYLDNEQYCHIGEV